MSAATHPGLRVLVVDDHEIVRVGLCATIGQRYAVVGTASTGAEALKLALQLKPDVVVADLRLPDMLGDELCRRLLERLPAMRVVMLSTYVSEETVRLAFQAGAVGYVTKAAGLPELLKVLARLEHGEPSNGVSAPQVVANLHALTASHVLTPQQESVLELAAQGLTNEQIGARLYLSESTVRFHLQKLKKKFDARSKTDLIARAIRAGAIPPALEDSTDE